MFTGSGILLLLLAGLSTPSPQDQAPAAKEASVTESTALARVRKICVDKLSGETRTVDAAREMAIAGLYASKRFSVLERCDKADVTLKGAVMERFNRKVRAEGESADFGVAAGAASASPGSARAAIGAALGGSGESLYSSETAANASVILRLVDSDGVVIWATTQESSGGKLKTAVPDAIDRSVRQLLRDVERAQKNLP
jgi:curli biogenesis system outer membrane secretion channel CsgG